MGICSSTPQPNELGTYPWEPEKLALAEQSINSGDPRVINFREYRYPVEDPVQMVVKDTESVGQLLTLKTYHYPAYYDQL